MYIIGTSGHIDHGKTSLIAALTDINCDRLPEEKEREMTIDIGFASIEYPRFGTVSIIDVPGHERFIRNMVVGAWGIDVALLLIAVDDGWMPQTEDHFRVLQLLNIERIIVVLNKIDLADEEMIEYVEMEVKEKLSDTRYVDSDIIKVSSKTNEGIEDLKELIVTNLRTLNKIADAKKPYLYIDRIFQSKGYGTITTGTLKNGNFIENEMVSILPIKKQCRIKKIESHYNSHETGSPSKRTALNLAGVDTDELNRGFIVYKNNFFTESKDIIANIKILDKNKKIKNNIGIELLIGTFSVNGKLILLDPEKNSDKFNARIKLEKPWFIYPSQPFILTNPGGHRVIGGGQVLFPNYDPKKYKSSIKKYISNFDSFSKNDIIYLIIKVNNFINENSILEMFPDKDKTLLKIIDALIDEEKIILLENHIFTVEFYNSSLKIISEVIENNIGLNIKEISDLSKINIDACKLLSPVILKESMIMEKEGRFFGGERITEDTLSPNKKKILKLLLDNKTTGLELDKLDDKNMIKEIKDLIKLNFIISLDGNIIYHKNTYSDLKNAILKLFDTQEKISVPDVKETIGLSRKYSIPFLNRVERDGDLKRIGDFRIRG